MRKGREIVDSLKGVDADPKLKIIIGELAYNIYELYKQQSEIVGTINMLIESHAKIVNGIGNQMNAIRNKLNIVDSKDEDTSKVTDNL